MKHRIPFTLYINSFTRNDVMSIVAALVVAAAIGFGMSPWVSALCFIVWVVATHFIGFCTGFVSGVQLVLGILKNVADDKTREES